MANAASGDLYMGFDLSTQQCKCLVVSSDLKLAHSALVDFDADLAHHGIKKGVLTNPAENEIFAPVAMWLEALDLVLSRLHSQGLDFGRVKGIAGAGMQHGTVFWGPNAEKVMGSLDSGKGLAEQLIGKSADGKWKDVQELGAFAHEHSPNWQDASTQKQCEEFDKCLGSPEKLAEVTGSKAHHRFSGPQIMRYRQKYPDHYAKTSRISLVSSFISSVFLGKVAPIDISDVTGMNLWDVHNGKWHEDLLTLCAGGASGVASLREKLGHVFEDGGRSFGAVSPYFVSRYGFSKDCSILPATGDNPATILALPLREGDAIVSLGTSTTFLMSTPVYKPNPAYHFMNHPTTAGLYMFMLCYKNGGLAREQVRDALNVLTGQPERSWEKYNSTALSDAVLGQPDSNPKAPMKLGLFFPRPEIVPNVKAGTWRFLYEPSKLTTSSPSHTDIQAALTPLSSDEDTRWGGPATDARAIVESQFLSLRLRSASLVLPQKSASGVSLPAQPRRVYLVGGGSQNAAIADLCGQVLGGAEGIFRLDIGGNACALGAAYKAVWGVERKVHQQQTSSAEELVPNFKQKAGEGIETFEEFIEARWDEKSFVKKIAEGYREGVFERYGEAVKGFDGVEKWVLERFGEE
ncbi:Carbohydrate kinase FGGY [Lasiodiplodia theobromae]|uniref:Xylulose kinase n=1 Tax=Lasiodiplodia theobromae TaxID=45133 RepID=A0A5N5D9H3_9PEZI|nr:D-xylulose kinase [Lasiodiplodia theobromae]KAB2574267.1 putative D-xylulose kinase A [Lasiodiplodia theobromae]KAF4543114.1 D-xylulose kinase [Lasiodiplodia theobromae]KAF9635688.1 Carbohydrate kinase FGGY [Lasiodiplodia theobromae]